MIKKSYLGIQDGATKARQLNALLQNIFEKGTDDCKADDELIGLAYELSGKVCILLDKIEAEEK